MSAITSPTPATSTTVADGRADRPADAATQRLAGATLATAPLVMVAGAVVMVSTGVEFDAASQAGTVPSILADVAANTGALTVTFSLWLAAMVVFAVAGRCLTRLSFPSAAAHAASALMAVGATMGAVAFGAYLTVVNAAAPGGATDVAVALTWFASNVDWVATILIVGLPAALLVLADAERFPTWMRPTAALPLLASVATLVSLLGGTGLDTFGFVLVPVGVAFTTATGVTLWRRA